MFAGLMFIILLVCIGWLIFSGVKKKPILKPMLFMFLALIIFFIAASTSGSSKKDAADVEKTEQVKVNKIKARAKSASKSVQELDDYPLLGHYELIFNNSKLTGIQVYCDESLATASPDDVKHYFSYGVQVGMKALNSDSKSPVVQVYSGNKMIAKSSIDNNMTFKDLR